MPFQNALSLALLALALPTAGAAQNLWVNAHAKTAAVYAQPEIACPAGAEGFEIAAFDIPASLRATGHFSVHSRPKVRIRKGTSVESGRQGFRPALQNVTSKHLSLDLNNGTLSTQGTSSLYATTSIRLTGCRSGDDLDITGGHLRVIGQADKFRIELDEILATLTKTDGSLRIVEGDDVSYSIADTTGLLGPPPGKLGMLRFGFRRQSWTFPSADAGRLPLEASLGISFSATLSEARENTRNLMD